MAKLQDGFSSLDELLICGICEEPYDQGMHQAKFLKCHHTYCSQCLTKLSNKERVQPAIIQCPSCRSPTSVPQNGVDGLQTNFYVSRVQEFSENTSALRNIDGCYRHNMQPLSHFCITCGTLICRDCKIVKHITKEGHSVICVSKEEIDHLEELNVSDTLMTLQRKNLKFVESEVTLLAAAKETAIANIEIFIKHAHGKLEQRKTDLMNLISDQFNDLHESLIEKQNQIEKTVENLNEDIIQAKNIIKTGGLHRLKTTSESLKEVNAEIKKILFKSGPWWELFGIWFETRIGWIW